MMDDGGRNKPYASSAGEYARVDYQLWIEKVVGRAALWGAIPCGEEMWATASSKYASPMTESCRDMSTVVPIGDMVKNVDDFHEKIRSSVLPADVLFASTLSANFPK
ncbi:hypothetical protein RB195_013194 [Necator americanus]|uniref:Uncharacterized protein n=1 Tax=Necator americanus TaxID=51031 RepID=A0ABR1DX31_NECAM